jgi:hypothetical protein
MFNQSSNLLKTLTNRLPKDSWIYALASFKGLHTFERYLEVQRIAKKNRVQANLLDVGAGEYSPLKTIYKNVLSLDVRKKKDLDIIASVTALPFIDGAFNCITAIDLLEHLKKVDRTQALNEMKRVGNFVIIHLPLDDGKNFMAKSGDLALYDYINNQLGYSERMTLEHLKNDYSTLSEIIKEGFVLVRPDWNLETWRVTAELSYVLPDALAPFINILYLILLRKNSPPWWGAYLIYKP